MLERPTMEGWRAAWRLAGVADADPALGSDVLARWSDPVRRYHTLQHLGECLALLAVLQPHVHRPGELALALWFHDAIYDPAGADNEARSAAWAASAMNAAGLDTAASARVHAMIMATRHDAQPTAADADARARRDTALLLDIDLSILGAAADRFDEYDRQVRDEYRHVPDPAFRSGRLRVLQSFAARDPLYLSEPMRTLRETQARANLARAIAALQAA